MPVLLEDKGFTAGEIRDLCGLSYRQINDWDSRGALPGGSDRGGNWRRFSARDVFIVMVCSEIRTRFGVPVEKLKFVREFMNQEGANHLNAAITLMQILGTGVWLVTDLSDYFIMDSEMEFSDMLSMGALASDKTGGLIWIKVNPLVNKIIEKLGAPEGIKEHRTVPNSIMEDERKRRTKSKAEYELLQLVRSGDYQNIKVELADGKVKTIRTSKLVDAATQVRAILDEQEFQNITITKRGGEIFSITQEVTQKVNDA